MSKRKKNNSIAPQVASLDGSLLVTTDDEEFPIIGVGASAGGLEACESLFSTLPVECGMSFVVVVHLDPTHVSLMPELLQKNCKIPVTQVVDGERVSVDHIYIIPANKSLTIVDRKLHLSPLEKPRQKHLPIDAFLNSLAKDQGSHAIAIILSGSGSDGTIGIASVKDACGMVMVQDPTSAKFTGMPESAIKTGLVDFTMLPGKMHQQLNSFLKFGRTVPDSRLSLEEANTVLALQQIFVILQNQTDKDFSQYKRNTIIRRIERRMNLHQLESIGDYVFYLQNNRQEVFNLFKELLIGVTSFFRDTKAFESLKSKALPAMLASKPEGYVIRVWVPGCSTGEEAYSIGMILKEVMEQLNRHFSVQIFATDLDENAIDCARAALYSPNIALDVNEDRLNRFFKKEENGQYRIRKSLRDMLVFAPQNVIKDPPFTKLDILSCRNLLIYFDAELQRKLLPLFYYSLKPEGLLFLGSSESLGHFSELFKPVEKKWKLFSRAAESVKSTFMLMPPSKIGQPNSVFHSHSEHEKPTMDVDAMQLLEAILSDTDTPPSIIIDDENNIIYVHGRTGQFLEQPEGKPSTNLLNMARAGLKTELGLAIHKVRTSRKPHTIQNLAVRENDRAVHLDLTVKPVLNQTALPGLKMVVFKENTVVKENQKSDENSVVMTEIETTESEMTSRELALVQELTYVKESLQTTIEELEVSNEELKSTNEELQSTNEELQSTNEEMETSKEELQSLNEESSTVNAELQSRIDELSAANDDMKNLLDSTDIATIFLDSELCVRRFTPRANTIIPLVSADAGRPLKHFSSNLINVELVELAQKVLEDLAIREQEVWSNDGQAFQMRLRPYRTINNVIDGVVITFEDISLLKKTQQLTQVNAQLFLSVSELVQVGIFHAEPNGKCLYVNPAWSNLTGFESSQIAKLKHILNAHQDDTEKVLGCWERMVSGQSSFQEEYRFLNHKDEPVCVSVSASRVLDDQGETIGVVGILRLLDV